MKCYAEADRAGHLPKDRGNCTHFVVRQFEAQKLLPTMSEYRAGEITFGRFTEVLEEWVNDVVSIESTNMVLLNLDGYEEEEP